LILLLDIELFISNLSGKEVALELIFNLCYNLISMSKWEF
jgi:hypothetical protein